MENLYKLPFRNWSNIDMNVINYIAFHHIEWESFIKTKKGIYLNFSDFRQNFEISSNKMFDYLNLESLNKVSSTDKAKIYKNPFTKEKQNIFYKFKIRLFNKLIDLLSKVSPIVAKKFRVKSRVPPRKKLDLEINEKDILFLKKLIVKLFQNIGKNLALRIFYNQIVK